jgi:hypothetical protein
LNPRNKGKNEDKGKPTTTAKQVQSDKRRKALVDAFNQWAPLFDKHMSKHGQLTGPQSETISFVIQCINHKIDDSTSPAAKEAHVATDKVKSMLANVPKKQWAARLQNLTPEEKQLVRDMISKITQVKYQEEWNSLVHEGDPTASIRDGWSGVTIPPPKPYARGFMTRVEYEDFKRNFSFFTPSAELNQLIGTHFSDGITSPIPAIKDQDRVLKRIKAIKDSNKPPQDIETAMAIVCSRVGQDSGKSEPQQSEFPFPKPNPIQFIRGKQQSMQGCVSKWDTTEDPLRPREEDGPEVKETKEMLDKDKRLSEADKKLIIIEVLRQIVYSPDTSKTLGDVVKECVDRHLAKINALHKHYELNPSLFENHDLESTIRLLQNHLKYIKRAKSVITSLDAMERSDTNAMRIVREGIMIREINIQYLINTIPNNSLELEVSSGQTVRKLIEQVAKATTSESVKAAIEKKLETNSR